MQTLDSFHVGEPNLGRGHRNRIEPYITSKTLNDLLEHMRHDRPFMSNKILTRNKYQQVYLQKMTFSGLNGHVVHFS